LPLISFLSLTTDHLSIGCSSSLQRLLTGAIDLRLMTEGPLLRSSDSQVSQIVIPHSVSAWVSFIADLLWELQRSTCHCRISTTVCRSQPKL